MITRQFVAFRPEDFSLKFFDLIFKGSYSQRSRILNFLFPLFFLFLGGTRGRFLFKRTGDVGVCMH